MSHKGKQNRQWTHAFKNCMIQRFKCAWTHKEKREIINEEFFPIYQNEHRRLTSDHKRLNRHEIKGFKKKVRQWIKENEMNKGCLFYDVIAKSDILNPLVEPSYMTDKTGENHS